MTQPASLYIARESGLHRLHPLTMLSLSAFALVAGLTIPQLLSGYAILLVFLVPLALYGRLTQEFLKWTGRIVLPFAISVFLIQGLFWVGGTPIISLGPLSFKLEGLIFAVSSTGRILAVVGSILLLAMATRPDALMIALEQRGFPATISYIVLTTIQIVPQFQTKATTVLDAQRSRGLETGGNLLHRARTLLPLVAPLVISSLVDIEKRAIALEARAFKRRGPKTRLMVLQDTPLQKLARWGLLITLPLLVIARLVWALWR